MSDALGDDFFEIFDVFLVETFFFFFLSSLPCMGQRLQKKHWPPKRPYFAPFPGKIIRGKKIYIHIYIYIVVLVVAGRQKVPSLLEGHRIVFYHSFQRPRHLPHPHPGMLHTKVVIAHLTECSVVNLEEALPHPF